MNAALAIYRRYVYVGNRTDGSNRCGAGDPRGAVDPDSCPHPHPGILVVDTANPANPTVVAEFGQEFVTGSNQGQTSRELRVWPQQKLLMVMYFRCSPQIHACPPSPDSWRIRFFNLADPVHPRLLATYVPSTQAARDVPLARPREPDPSAAVAVDPDELGRPSHRQPGHHRHWPGPGGRVHRDRHGELEPALPRRGGPGRLRQRPGAALDDPLG